MFANRRPRTDIDKSDLPQALRPQVNAALSAPSAPQAPCWPRATDTTTPREYLAAAQADHLGDGIAQQFKCPTLVCEAEKGLFFSGQAQQLFRPPDLSEGLAEVTDAEGARAHSEFGASRLAFAGLYDWLDETLRT
jgi:hypothetical protein